MQQYLPPREGKVLHLDAHRCFDSTTGRRYLAGEAVSAWADLGGIANSPTQNAAILQPMISTVSAGISFNGLYKSLTAPTTISVTSFTVLAAIRPSSYEMGATYGNTILAASSLSAMLYPLWLTSDEGAIRCYAFSGATNVFGTTASGLVPLNTWTIAAATATISSTARIYINGQVRATFTAGARQLNSTICIGDLRDNRGLGFVNGDIGDVLVYTRIIPTPELARLTRHFCAKYRITYQGA